jgi:hypothetical protein
MMARLIFLAQLGEGVGFRHLCDEYLIPKHT